MRAEPLTDGPLTLDPLHPDHAPEMTPVLADPALYAFTGGSPPSTADLHRRYTAQSAGRSPDGSQWWLNWVIRLDGTATGYVQATVEARTADLAWVVGTPFQHQGLARRAATLMTTWLRTQGTTHLRAHIHPAHTASESIARHLGLTPTGTLADGEQLWTTPT